MTAKEAFEEAGALAKGEKSQMFGKPCYKTGGKAFLCFFEDCAVFKLTGELHRKALALKGSTMFDPSAKGRPMKEWVQVPAVHQKEWNRLATAARDYVKNGK
jgi:hypothetical protein